MTILSTIYAHYNGHMDELGIEHLRTFVAVAQERSLQAAARLRGHSRTTFARHLAELREALGAPVLLERAPGQRVGVLTAPGEILARRAQAMLDQWDRWWITTRDALAQAAGAVRVGTLAGSFDLIAELLADLRAGQPELALRIVEYPEHQLIEAVQDGVVDLGFGTLGFGTAGPEEIPRLTFERLGPLPWAVIVPRSQADRFAEQVSLVDLAGVPMVVPREGPARLRIERAFAEHLQGPLVLEPAFEVGSTPRLVDMVARGFGPALVSQFRLAFLPEDVVSRPLVDGPSPLLAGVYARTGATLPEATRTLVEAARVRFAELSREPATSC